MSSTATSKYTSSTQSLSSWLDSSNTSVLNASGWNRQKANRPITPRRQESNFSTISDDDDDDSSESNNNDNGNENDTGETKQRPARHLLQKRYYQRPSLSALSESGSRRSSSSQLPEKSEIEILVLTDCLSNHFLFSHLPSDALDRLVVAFEKVTFRDHEIIVMQGEESQYLYMVYSGDVKGLVKKDGEGATPDKYTVFGELSLLTQAPVTTTITADGNSTLFRLEQSWIQQALYPSTKSKAEDGVASERDLPLTERVQLLQSVLPRELEGLLDEAASGEPLDTMAKSLECKLFHKDDVLLQASQEVPGLVIISKGKVVSTNNTMAGRTYDDKMFGPGEDHTSFGWQSILETNDSTDDNNDVGEESKHFHGQMMAATDGIAWVLSKSQFFRAIGMEEDQQGKSSLLHRLAAKRFARTQLEQIPMIHDSNLTNTQIQGLLEILHSFEYSEGDIIVRARTKVDASMTFVRQGRVKLATGKGDNQSIEIVEAGGYYGEKNLLLDQNKDGLKHFEIRSPTTVTALESPTSIDILYLEDCRKVIDTTLLGLGRPPTISAIDETLQFEDVRRHTLLGAGSFGQVWLASVVGSGSNSNKTTQTDSTNPLLNHDANDENNAAEGCGDTFSYNPRTVALKVQSKHRLLEANQAKSVVSERNILASLQSPFILRLYNSFQDESRLYMITSLLQGGELESLVPQDGLSEHAAKFYAAGILEALSHMHQRHILHRDVKTENILLDEKGYPVLIDFGFGKYRPNKFCFANSCCLFLIVLAQFCRFFCGCFDSQICPRLHIHVLWFPYVYSS